MSKGKKTNRGIFKFFGFIVFLAIIVGAIYIFYQTDCTTNRQFLVWAQEKVGLYADKEGHIKQDATFKGNLGELEMDLNFTLKVDGKFELVEKTTLTGELKEEKVEGTYKIDKNLVALTTTDGEETTTEYAYLYKGIFVYGIKFFGVSLPIICTQEGLAVSQESSTRIIGYFFDIDVKVNDVESVINGKAQTKDKDGNLLDTGSKGQFYAIYANGKVAENPNPLSKDQITGFDSSEKGIVIVNVKVGRKSYKAPMYVG